MKIAFYEILEWQAKYLREHLPGFDMSFYTASFNQDNVPDKDAEIISTFIDCKLNTAVLQQLPNLKCVATRTTGFDHIDINLCKEKGIVVSNVPSYGENTVAEYAFALLLALSRKIYPTVKRIKNEARFDFKGLEGFDLQGKTLGVVGTGRIGARVVKIASGFGMKIVAYDPHQNEELAKQYNFSYLPLEELLKQSDIITLHVPYMPATHHLINKNNISLIKPGAVLINTARGALVETESLVEALKKGIVAGAGLDVIEEEGFVRDEIELLQTGHPNLEQLKTALVDHELMHMDNVLITPHNAFNTTEAIIRILDTTVENIKGFAEGKPQNNVAS